MKDEDKIDELINEIESYNDMLDNNKNINPDEEVIKEEKEVVKEEKPKIDLDEILDEKKEDNRIILTVCISVVSFLILILIIFLVTGILTKEKEPKKIETKVLTKEMYKTILDGYSEAVTKAVNNYMEKNNKLVPDFLSIKEDIYFPSYDVSCAHSIVNYDGSIYLSNCTIKGYENKYKYTYGELKEKPKESENQIFIYKSAEDVESYYASNYKYDFDTEYPKLIDTYDCENKECRGYVSNTLNNKDVVIYDSKYYLYNFNTHKKQELSGIGKKNYVSIDSILDDNSNTYALYVRQNDGLGAFYLVNKKKLVTDFKYNDNSTVKTMVSHGYFAGVKVTKNSYCIDIINQNTGEVFKSFNDVLFISEQYINDNLVYFLGSSTFGDATGYFLDSNYDKIVDSDKPYLYALNSNNTISVKKGNKFVVYDISGKKLYTSVEFDSVIKIIEDYVIVSSDGSVNILDFNGNLMCELFKEKKSYKYHTTISGWYNDEEIHFTVEDTSVEEGKVGRGLEYYYNFTTDTVGVNELAYIGGHD